MVTPSVLHDHIVIFSIDSMFVAAINAHKASSWKYGHVFSCVDGRSLLATVVKHNGAHVNNGFELLLVAQSNVNPEISHRLDGTAPITN